MKHEPIGDHAERKRISALIERCRKEQTMNKDTIYREDAVDEMERIMADHPLQGYEDELLLIDAIKSLPSSDIPQGDVDAVAIFEREMHNLDQGYITIGEFDERIEPLRHLCYGRPQGEWIPCSERLPKENTEVLMSLEWGIDIGEYRNGDWHSEWINHYDDGNVLAWMPLPQPYKGADDEA